jgi:hypothetical protein
VPDHPKGARAALIVVLGVGAGTLWSVATKDVDIHGIQWFVTGAAVLSTAGWAFTEYRNGRGSKPPAIPTPRPTTPYVFISYARADVAYAQRLEKHLRGHGVPVWRDSVISTGRRWRDVLERQIDGCAAMIVLVSPHIKKSEWVDEEVQHAKLRKKPILPLLLDGQPMFGLRGLQHHDVTGGGLPDLSFVAQVRRVIAATGRPVSPVSDSREHLAERHRQASQRGEADPDGAITELAALLADCSRLLGSEDRDTLAVRHNLAHWHGTAGRPADAVGQLEVLFSVYLRLFGPVDPDTFAVRRSLGHWLGHADDPKQAAAVLDTLLDDQVRVLGSDHPDTLVTQHHLAHWLGHAGDTAAAADAFDDLRTARLRGSSPTDPGVLAADANATYWRGRVGPDARLP